MRTDKTVAQQAQSQEKAQEQIEMERKERWMALLRQNESHIPQPPVFAPPGLHRPRR